MYFYKHNQFRTTNLRNTSQNGKWTTTISWMVSHVLLNIAFFFVSLLSSFFFLCSHCNLIHLWALVNNREVLEDLRLKLNGWCLLLTVWVDIWVHVAFNNWIWRIIAVKSIPSSLNCNKMIHPDYCTALSPSVVSMLDRPSIIKTHSNSSDHIVAQLTLIWAEQFFAMYPS